MEIGSIFQAAAQVKTSGELKEQNSKDAIAKYYSDIRTSKALLEVIERQKAEQKPLRDAFNRSKAEYETALAESKGAYTSDVAAAKEAYNQAKVEIDYSEDEALGRIDDFVSQQTASFKRSYKEQATQGSLEIRNQYLTSMEGIQQNLKRLEQQNGYAQKDATRQMTEEDKNVKREFEQTKEQMNGLISLAKQSKRQIQSGAVQRGLGFSKSLIAGLAQQDEQAGKAAAKIKTLSQFRLGQIDQRKSQITDYMNKINDSYTRGIQEQGLLMSQTSRTAGQNTGRLRTDIASQQANTLLGLQKTGLAQNLGERQLATQQRQANAAGKRADISLAGQTRAGSDAAAQSKFANIGLASQQRLNTLEDSINALGVEAQTRSREGEDVPDFYEVDFFGGPTLETIHKKGQKAGIFKSDPVIKPAKNNPNTTLFQ